MELRLHHSDLQQRLELQELLELLIERVELGPRIVDSLLVFFLERLRITFLNFLDLGSSAVRHGLY